jgi:flagellar biosynthetic protein FliS
MQQQYYANKPQDVYRRQAIMTASPVELIIMLYDGCRKAILLGQRAIEKNNPSEAHKQLTKAQDIIGELVSSLDMRYEVAEQLLDLYEFLLIELADANMSKSAAKLPDLLEMIETLRGTWQEVFDQQKKGNLSLAED